MTNPAEYDPLDGSLWGEYARMVLVGTAACSAAVWAVRCVAEPAASAMVVVNIALLAAVTSGRFAGLPRLVVLTLLTIGFVAFFTAKDQIAAWWGPTAVFSPAVAVGTLLLLILRDGWMAARTRAGAITLRTIVISAAFTAAAVYMIVIPGMDAFSQRFRERPTGYTLQELSAIEVLRVRSAKLIVFGIFAYAGACVGSFLNVVAISVPRGESIWFRSSACPKCGTSIRRLDNLPIVGYLRLGGRCRACESKIPVRYLAVELVGLAIFSLLFVCELVTGAANVPGFRHYYYAGILWIILYTKWPVVGIYFFHCILFSCLLMLALMEQDRLRPPRWMAITLLASFAIAVIAIPTLLTVSLADPVATRLPELLPAWIDRVATAVAGGVAGGVIGRVASPLRLRRGQVSSSFFLSFVLLGIALGWQAVFTIAALWLIATAVLRMAGGRYLRPRWLTPTSLLFAVAMLHHPFWKSVASLW
jgi:leader peptidase (prepilin peptidase)/N-methyltransferase